MKKLLILSLVTYSFSALSATVYSFYDGHQKYPLADFFYVSSFSKEIKHCYVGTTEGVCSDIKNGESKTMERYLDGAHDYFEIVSCTHDHDEYTVITKLYDDYGANGEELETKLGQCD